MDWAITISGLGTGLLLNLAYYAGKRARKSPAPGPVKAICPCTHGIQTHVDLKGKCTVGVQKPCRWDSNGNPSDYRYVACACLHYCGPELISSITMRPIADKEQPE